MLRKLFAIAMVSLFLIGSLSPVLGQTLQATSTGSGLNYNYLCGDANGDGRVDTADLFRLVLHITSVSKITDTVLYVNADLTGDKKLDINDATALVSYIYNNKSYVLNCRTPSVIAAKQIAAQQAVKQAGQGNIQPVPNTVKIPNVKSQTTQAMQTNQQQAQTQTQSAQQTSNQAQQAINLIITTQNNQVFTVLNQVIINGTVSTPNLDRVVVDDVTDPNNPVNLYTFMQMQTNDWSYSPGNIANGTYTFRFTAYDDQGNSDSEEITFTVNIPSQSSQSTHTQTQSRTQAQTGTRLSNQSQTTGSGHASGLFPDPNHTYGPISIGRELGRQAGTLIYLEQGRGFHVIPFFIDLGVSDSNFTFDEDIAGMPVSNYSAEISKRNSLDGDLVVRDSQGNIIADLLVTNIPDSNVAVTLEGANGLTVKYLAVTVNSRIHLMLDSQQFIAQVNNASTVNPVITFTGTDLDGDEVFESSDLQAIYHDGMGNSMYNAVFEIDEDGDSVNEYTILLDPFTGEFKKALYNSAGISNEITNNPMQKLVYTAGQHFVVKGKTGTVYENDLFTVTIVGIHNRFGTGSYGAVMEISDSQGMVLDRRTVGNGYVDFEDSNGVEINEDLIYIESIGLDPVTNMPVIELQLGQGKSSFVSEEGNYARLNGSEFMLSYITG